MRTFFAELAPWFSGLLLPQAPFWQFVCQILCFQPAWPPTNISRLSRCALLKGQTQSQSLPRPGQRQRQRQRQRNQIKMCRYELINTQFKSIFYYFISFYLLGGFRGPFVLFQSDTETRRKATSPLKAHTLMPDTVGVSLQSVGGLGKFRQSARAFYVIIQLAGVPKTVGRYAEREQ